MMWVNKFRGTLIFIVLYFYLSGSFIAQFQIIPDTFKVSNWPAIHSFSYGVFDDRVFIFGGRIDGIHEKESGFERNKNNHKLFIWNPHESEVDSIDLSFLPDSLLDPLSAAGTSFIQKGQFLFIVGGYGQNSVGDFVTYPSLIVIDLEKASDATFWRNYLMQIIWQVKHEYFQVAGAQLGVIDDSFILCGGNYFEGKYSDNSGKVIQRYPDHAVHFNLEFSNERWKVQFGNIIKDEFNFHRRDYNMAPFVYKGGEEALMIFSGVFLINENRPFLNIARLNPGGYEDINNFSQRFANYHCAKIGMYSKLDDQMYQIFFGGMSEYYHDSLDQIQRDPRVPFTKTISSIERNNENEYHERVLKNRLPLFVGTNSEVILISEIPRIRHQSSIIDFDLISKDTTLIGYMFGGIWNPGQDPNPWSNNNAHETRANPYIISLKLIKENNPSFTVEGKSKIYSLIKDIYFDQLFNELVIIPIDELNHEYSFWVVDQKGTLNRHFKVEHSGNLNLNLGDLAIGSYTIYGSVDKTSFNSYKFIKLK